MSKVWPRCCLRQTPYPVGIISSERCLEELERSSNRVWAHFARKKYGGLTTEFSNLVRFSLRFHRDLTESHISTDSVPTKERNITSRVRTRRRFVSTSRLLPSNRKHWQYPGSFDVCIGRRSCLHTYKLIQYTRAIAWKQYSTQVCHLRLKIVILFLSEKQPTFLASNTPEILVVTLRLFSLPRMTHHEDSTFVSYTYYNSTRSNTAKL